MGGIVEDLREKKGRKNRRSSKKLGEIRKMRRAELSQ